MSKIEIIQKIGAQARKPKVRVALSLAIAAVGLVAPKDSKSYSYCSHGSNGDCVTITDGNKHCATGDFWNDCT